MNVDLDNQHRMKPWIICEAADCDQLAEHIIHFDDTSFLWCDHHV